MSRKYFYVNVRLLNGRCMIYKLPRDLQYPMWQYVNENPKKWQNLLKEALINVPIRPYKNNKSVIRVGIIKSVFIKKEILYAGGLDLENKLGVIKLWKSLH